jgi:restriction system protein
MSPRRALWQATDSGRAYVQAHPHALTEQEVLALARVERDPDGPASAEAYVDDVGSSARHQSPDERIDDALSELREQTANELLEQISLQSPAFFEQLVLDLLHALGYGTSRGDIARVGRSGDGGIDGIISLDKLGLEKVYVQAKRWQSNVGRPDVQSFFGALAGRRATKGVFISTSSYTREAREFAESVSDKITLVDGVRLAQLMMDHGVGVQHRELRVPRVDSDYFEDA